MSSLDERAAAIGRWVLVAAVAILPLRALLVEHLAPPARLQWVDELVLVLAASSAVVVRLKSRTARPQGELVLLVLAAIFTLVCALSAWNAGTGISYFVLGTADYLKGFALLWSAAVLDSPQLRERVARIVLAIVAVAAVIELVDFALVNATSKSLLFSRGEHLREIFGVTMHRPVGLIGHPNLSGLYLVLGLAMALSVWKSRWPVVVAFYAAAMLSLSRLVFAATFVILLPLLWRRRWLFAPLAVSAVCILGSIQLTAKELNSFENVAGQPVRNPSEPWHYRTFTTDVAMRIWRGHKFLGVGPGRFGGVISVSLGSPVYDDYPFPPHHRKILENHRTIDRFYTQLLAEVGALGALAFAFLGAALIFFLGRASRVGQVEREWPLAGMLALLVVPVYGLGAGLNVSEYLVTAVIIAGMGLSTRPTDRQAG